MASTDANADSIALQDLTAQSTFGSNGNILEGRSRESLHGEVKSFLLVNELETEGGPLEQLLLKAAETLQWEGKYTGRALEEKAHLDEGDWDVLKSEGEWKAQPRELIFAIAMNSVAAIVQGWDQSGTNGANLFWPLSLIEECSPDFSSTNSALAPSSTTLPVADTSTYSQPCQSRSLDPLVGLVNAAPYIMITVVGCWLSDPLNHLFGRPRTIFIGAIFSVIAPICSAFSQTWPQLFGSRLLLGLGMGLKEVTVPILSAEIAPRQLRGALVMFWQIFTAFGIMLGCCANLISLHITENKDLVWRLQVGSAVIPAVPLLLFILRGPESPRWQMQKKMYRRAYETLLRLRGGETNKLLAAKDFYYLKLSMETRDRPVVGNRVFHLFTRSRIRRATVASSVIMISQQLCGINILAFYSSTIFAKVLNPEDDGDLYAVAQDALLFTFGMGVINFIFAWPAFLKIDKVGRRPLLLTTIPLMSLFLLVGGSFHSISTEDYSRARLAAITLFLYLFVVAYSPGMGPVPFVYSAEIFPITHREIGMGWAVAMNNLFGTALALSFPLIYSRFWPEGAGTFFFFSGLNIISLILIFLLMPETKQRALEEINVIFGIPTKRHVRHEVEDVLPWAARRVIGREDKRCPVFTESQLGDSAR